MFQEKIAEAMTMLDAFVSVGSKRFDLTRTNMDRVRTDYRAGRNIGAMKLLLPHLVPLCWERQENLIIRPEKPLCGILAQLDDLDAGQLDRVRSRAFLLVETSPGNHQAWIAIEDGNGDFVKRLVKGVSSDWRANCSGRMAGSPNCKPKYAPKFPAVRIAMVELEHKTTCGELEELAAPAAPPRSPAPLRFTGSAPRGWPEYAHCLQGASPRKDGKPDRSKADYMWSKWALERGNSMDAVMAKLLEVSEKAREEWDRGNQDYMRRTVEAAERAV